MAELGQGRVHDSCVRRDACLHEKTKPPREIESIRSRRNISLIFVVIFLSG